MNKSKPISTLEGLVWAIIAAGSLIVANTFHFPALTLLFVFGLLKITTVPSPRKAFYLALTAGMILIEMVSVPCSRKPLVRVGIRPIRILLLQIFLDQHWIRLHSWLQFIQSLSGGLWHGIHGRSAGCFSLLRQISK
jgi:hypothetical protein